MFSKAMSIGLLGFPDGLGLSRDDSVDTASPFEPRAWSCDRLSSSIAALSFLEGFLPYDTGSMVGDLDLLWSPTV